MDTLFESLNINDLLSARDLTDPTTPLSAPDLRLLITKLESHSLQIKSKVQSYLTHHRSDFSHLFSLSNDAVRHSTSISQTFSNLLESLSSRPVDVEITELVKRVEETVREVRLVGELLEIVRVVFGFKERLDWVRECVRVWDLEGCATEVRDLKRALRVGEDEEGEPAVYRVLRSEWSDRFDEIQEVLVRFMGDAVRFEEESNRVRVKYRLDVDGSKDRVDLLTVLKAMDVVGILDYGLAKVADLIIKHVVTPIVTHGSSISSIEESNHDTKDINEAILKIGPTCTPKIEDADPEKIFLEIVRVIKFIYKCICFKSDSWILCFGRLTWPRISDLIISKVLSKIVPKDAMKLVDFEKIIKLTSDFESTLKEMKFISATDNKDERLSSFAENVETHFAYKKKQELLSKARNLLLKCDFSIPQDNERMGPTADHVVDLLFLSERCVVSEAASELMKLVHQTLQDACLSSARVALEFYHAARDAILLYEAIIPVKLERRLHSVNHVAVLIHNDSLYLSQEILGLAFEYRSYLPSAVQDYAVFVDLSPRFQKMGEEILQGQIQLVIRNLKEAIDSADGFQNTHQIRQFESAKFTIDQVVFILEKVRIIWEPLLITVTYQRSMCTVLESVFSRITKDILLLDDIAAEETLQLQRLIQLLLENLSSLFDSLVTTNENREVQNGSTHVLNDLIPSLSKIRKLAELLDMPLKIITTSWESGELVGCGFTLAEVKDFIRAIFTDSPLRKECLWRIENSSF